MDMGGAGGGGRWEMLELETGFDDTGLGAMVAENFEYYVDSAA
jgi:hypothetical protein